MNLNITDLFKELLEIAYRRKVMERTSCFAPDSSKDRKLANTRSQPNQPPIPTFGEIMKTKFNRWRSKSENGKQDNFLIEEEKTKSNFSKNAFSRQENIGIVGMRQNTSRSRYVTAPKIYLQKESKCEGTD